VRRSTSWPTCHGSSIRVTFTKTGEQRYAIAAARDDGSVLHMPTAPGYDPWLPHDLVHFVVEQHFDIALGVFGQLAAGGDAGTFFPIPHRRRDRSRLSGRLGELGRQDTARSERLAGACMAAWHERHGQRWKHSETVERAAVGHLPEALLAELDAVAERWHSLPVGGELTLTWPTRLTVRPAGLSRGRRATRERRFAVNSR
jgi:hypothetical protein